MSKNHKTHVIILSAGKGSRMRSSKPKVMHPIGHYPMIGHCILQCQKAGATDISVLISDQMEEVATFVAPLPTIIQKERLGTAHAVKTALPYLQEYQDNDDLLILYGDTPLISHQVIKELIAYQNADILVVGFEQTPPHQYGRLVMKDKELIDIIEDKDCTEEQKHISYVNSGVMKIKFGVLRRVIEAIQPYNAQNEYYLTDIIAIAHRQSCKNHVLFIDAQQCKGVNNLQDLSVAESYFQQQKRLEFLEHGVTMLDPSSVFLAYDTIIHPNVTIEPFVTIGAGVVIESHSYIKSFSHLEGAKIGQYCTIGPHARLRKGTIMDNHVHIGNFVEVKNTHLHHGVKAGHLSYLGDADIGEQTNIGAGTITCNYDGFHKHKTSIGSHVFVGSHTALVAPVFCRRPCYYRGQGQLFVNPLHQML